MTVPVLETPRLILRPWSPEDAEDMYAYAKSPLVGPAAGWKPHESLAESREILKGFLSSQDSIWATQLRETGRVVGSVGLHQDGMRHNANSRIMGYVLSDKCWGRGLIPEAAHKILGCAFGAMGLDVVTISHFPQNSRSKGVIEKLGFRYEGTLRHSYRIYDGTVLDELVYSMLKSEYRPERLPGK